jgi:hypothetical protein
MIDPPSIHPHIAHATPLTVRSSPAFALEATPQAAQLDLTLTTGLAGVAKRPSVAIAQQRQATDDRYKRIRGPQLAAVELAWRRVVLAERGHGHADVREALTALAAAVLAYWRRLGHTVSLAADIRRYVRELARRSPTAAAWLTDQLRSAWAAESPTELHPLRRQVRFRFPSPPPPPAT